MAVMSYSEYDVSWLPPLIMRVYYTIGEPYYSGSKRYAELTIDSVSIDYSQYNFRIRSDHGSYIEASSGNNSLYSTINISASGSDTFSGELFDDINKSITIEYNTDGDAIGSVRCEFHNNSVLYINTGGRVGVHITHTFTLKNYLDNIGQAYTDPNITITSINGVNIPTGSGRYSIAINGNQNITIGYSEWDGAIDVDSCSINAWIKPYDRNKANLSYKTIKNDGNGKPAGSSLYRRYNNSSDPATPIGSGVPFAYDGQQVWIYAQRHHSSTDKNSKEVLHSNIRLMRILYTPIKSVTFNTQPAGLYESRQAISISWSYPSAPSLINQYGIVSGYEIRLIDKNRGTTVLTATTTGTSYTLPSNSYNPLTRYYLQVIPYYLNGSSKSYGPSKNSNDFMLVTKLSAPTISYPNTGTNCVWIGNKLYVLAQLPYDVDASYVDGYLYRDIEVTVNGRSFTFRSNSGMFSINNLTHNARFVFTTKNTNITFSTSYVIKVRVQKNYTFDGTYRWSDYSTITLNAVAVPSIPSYSGYIMASHYTPIYNLVRNMRNCYKTSSDKIRVKTVSRGSQINRSDFQNAYNDLNNISQLIDQWGDYSKDLKTKFSQNNKFTPKIEYITNVKNDTNPTGNNYFILSYEWIRYYG